MWPFNKQKVKTKKRKYEGAAKGRRTAGWITGWGDANAAIGKDLPTLRERSRDLRRNNAYINRAISLVTNNVVGKGVMTQFENDDINNLWKDWAHTTAIDYDGKHNIKGLQRIVMDAIAESGEVLIRRRVVAGLTFPFQYQILESDFLDQTIYNTKKQSDDNFVIQGVEFDANGKIVGYHVYQSHPGSIDRPINSLKSNFIPASEMLHIYRKDRPGQVRGVPWPSPIMIKIKDLSDFEDAQLMRQKIAACFTAFVHDISADVDCDDDSEEALGSKIEPALIEHLPPGKTITFASPPGVENYKEFTSQQIRAVAIGMGLSYESLSGDLSEVNFSSARMGWLEMGRNIDVWREDLIIMQMLTRMVTDFKTMLSLTGTDASREKATHIPPKREMIDPTKEIPASIDAIRAGLSSRSDEIASLGKDPEDVYKKQQKDNEKADEAGLVLDSDPRKTDQSGKLHNGEENEQDD